MTDSWRWPTCGRRGCVGACVDGETRCLAHVRAKKRHATLQRFSESGRLDVRGVTISDALFREIVAAAPQDADGHRTFSAARFNRATFKGEFNPETLRETSFEFNRATFKRDTEFAEATFEGDASFNGAIFEDGAASFDEATFKGRASFDGATFKGGASFRAIFKGIALFRATFEDASFGGATFEDDAFFTDVPPLAHERGDGATFKGDTWFVGATFKGRAWFDGVTFEGDTEFARVTFEGRASFPVTTFKRDTEFDGAIFEGGARFDGAIFEGDTGFARVTFKSDVPVLGPISVAGGLDLDGVQFASAVRIEADASALTCRRGRFQGGVRFDVRRADVRLDDTDLSVPSSLLTGPSASGPAGTAEQPKLLSLQGANVAELAVGNVNLAACRFAGAHHLDELRLEAGTVFGLSPAVAGWESRQVIAEEAAWRAAGDTQSTFEASTVVDFRRGPARVLSPGDIAGLYRVLRKGAYAVFGLSPAVAGWERRQVIAEGAGCRADRARPSRWSVPAWPADWDDKPKALSPGAVAVLYRALRKSREDAKDEPGAADFYYGEMEMRRHDRGESDAKGGWSRGLVSRGVLTAYWLVSGYCRRKLNTDPCVATEI